MNFTRTVGRGRSTKRGSGTIARLLVAGLPLALLAFDAFAQSTASLISVGDHRLEVIAKGEGNPTVVFESGFAGGLVLWRTVQDRVAERTRTIAYERAG